MSGLSLVLGSSQRKQFTWCQDLSTCQLGRSQRQGQVQPFACTENIWRQDDPPFSIFLVLGSFSLHVNSPQDSGFQAFKWEYRFLELYSGFHGQAFFCRIPNSTDQNFLDFRIHMPLQKDCSPSALGSVAPSFLSLTFSQPKRGSFLLGFSYSFRIDI